MNGAVSWRCWQAARHSLELLGHAGDAFLTDSATIGALLRKPAATV